MEEDGEDGEEGENCDVENDDVEAVEAVVVLDVAGRREAAAIEGLAEAACSKLAAVAAAPATVLPVAVGSDTVAAVAGLPALMAMIAAAEVPATAAVVVKAVAARCSAETTPVAVARCICCATIGGAIQPVCAGGGALTAGIWDGVVS